MGWDTAPLRDERPWLTKRKTANGSYAEVGNFVARGANSVDPRMRSIMAEAAAASGLRIEAYSGYRPNSSGSKHAKGVGMDVRIIGVDGKEVPNFQNAQGYGQYQQLAHTARKIQQAKYPELNDQFRWGGYFGGQGGSARSKGNAMDSMHFDFGGGPNLGMAAGSWERGLSPSYAKQWGVKAGLPAAQGIDGANGDFTSASTARIGERNAKSRDTLIRTVIGEAANEDAMGQAAVAHVIINRAKDSRWAPETHAVARQPQQFSAWNTGAGGNSLPNKYNPGDPMYDKVASVVDGVLRGDTKDPTEGATHYYAPAGMPGGREPTWFASVARDSGNRGQRIGGHIFTGRSKGNQEVLDVPAAVSTGRGNSRPDTTRVLVEETVPSSELEPHILEQMRLGAPAPKRQVWKERQVKPAENTPAVKTAMNKLAVERQDAQKVASGNGGSSGGNPSAGNPAPATQSASGSRNGGSFLSELASLRGYADGEHNQFVNELARSLDTGLSTNFARYGEFDSYFQQ